MMKTTYRLELVRDSMEARVSVVRQRDKSWQEKPFHVVGVFTNDMYGTQNYVVFGKWFKLSHWVERAFRLFYVTTYHSELAFARKAHAKGFVYQPKGD